jgi:hypothetical protein
MCFQLPIAKPVSGRIIGYYHPSRGSLQALLDVKGGILIIYSFFGPCSNV